MTVIRPTEQQREHSSVAAFGRGALGLHVDGAGEPVPPPVITLLVKHPSISGGNTILVDAREVLDRLAKKHARTTAALQIRLQMRGQTFPLLDQSTPGDARIIVRYRDDGAAQPLTTLDRENLESFKQALHVLRHEIAFKTDEGYIVHNHRWLHGRTPFVGTREVHRLLGQLSEQSDYQHLNRGFGWD